jgi:hypothetical protein
MMHIWCFYAKVLEEMCTWCLNKFGIYYVSGLIMAIFSGALLLESKIQPDTAYQKQQVNGFM